MERIAFLLEETGERIDCLLNPESFVVRRMAGVQSRRSIGGPLTGAALTDDPLLYTGGGRTELTLDLLFDVSLATNPTPLTDVRAMTQPLWNLAENRADERSGKPTLVRFIWGKAWNVPAVVAAVAERYEYFTPEGVPQRSWLRMRLVRVSEPAAEETPIESTPFDFTPLPEDHTLPGFEERRLADGDTAPAAGGGAT
jgi:hypothetical protein